jgi:hypothetical protein
VIAGSSVYAYSIATQSNLAASNNNGLFIESFSLMNYGSTLIGGRIVLVNPTDQTFEDLTLSLNIDDSELIAPNMSLWMPLPIPEPFKDRFIPVTKISIEPSQNQTIGLYLYDPDQNEPPFYQTTMNIQTFSSHTIKFYITKNTFGDIINGQSLTIPQQKAYLQITGYSQVEHSNDTWHQHFNSSTNRYEYINDKPNFYQQYHQSAYYPMTPTSYNWAKVYNQLGESYFNVTVFNNSTFPVKAITLFEGSSPDGQSILGSALIDHVLQPNETYVFPVSASEVPMYGYMTGDLVDNQAATNSNFRLD